MGYVAGLGTGETLDLRRFQQRVEMVRFFFVFTFLYLSKSHMNCSYSVITAACVHNLRGARAAALLPTDEATVQLEGGRPLTRRRGKLFDGTGAGNSRGMGGELQVLLVLSLRCRAHIPSFPALFSGRCSSILGCRLRQGCSPRFG